MTLELVETCGSLIGKPLEITFNITNHSAEKRTVKLTLTVQIVHYTGVPGRVLKTESYDVEVPPEEGKNQIINI